MDIGNQWDTIQTLWKNSFRSSLHCCLASIGDGGSPHITPFGSLFLRDDNTGFYFEEFFRNTSRNLKHNQRICILFVNSSKLYWMKSLFFGKFSTPPAVRIYGTVGEKRKATNKEIELLQNRVKLFKFLKGYNLLWGNFEFVRDIHFDSFEPVNTGAMSYSLWKKYA